MHDYPASKVFFILSRLFCSMAAFTATVFFTATVSFPGKKTLVIEIAMKRLGNRSDKIKKPAASRVTSD